MNRIPSPLGAMRLVTGPQGTVWALDFANSAAQPAAAGKIADQLRAYFAGDLGALEDIPVADEGTDFQREFWAALRKIPAGTTTTYGELARSLGYADPRMAKEVGAAVGANPVAIIVPCHRVIGKDGSLRGYRWGLERKRALLEHEAR